VRQRRELRRERDRLPGGDAGPRRGGAAVRPRPAGGRNPGLDDLDHPDLPVEDGKDTIERYGSHAYSDLRADEEPVFNLACLNGDHLADQIRRHGGGLARHAADDRAVGGWETDVLPARAGTAAFDYVDEGLGLLELHGREPRAGCCRCRSSGRAARSGRAGRSTAGALTIAQDDRFTFLFMLDLFSTLRRKNPIGLVEGVHASVQGPAKDRA